VREPAVRMRCQARDEWTRVRRHLRLWSLALIAPAALLASACGGRPQGSAAVSLPAGPAGNLSGSISADGSSTVGPLMQLAAERFATSNPRVSITVGVAGTGGGFQRFCAGETDISDASRPIKPEEAAACKKQGIAYSQIAVANDGISIIVNPDNTWVSCLTIPQLAKIWGEKSDVGNWHDLDPAYPGASMRLYGPGTDSGTFDFFTAQVNGEEDVSRSDYSASEDDNVIVQGVGGDRGALGYPGLSYAEENASRIKLLAVDGGHGCVKPSAKTVQDGSYAPLSRPLFVYVKHRSAQRPEVKAFLDYLVTYAGEIASAARFVPLTLAQRATALTGLAAAVGE
jgi:phosphate transport system substrate-binding protein